MQPASTLILSEVEAPRVKMALPPLRQGDKLQLRFKLERIKNGRTEVLDVQGEFRVTSVSLTTDQRQEVAVESTGKTPSWRAVKRRPTPTRKVGPTRFPRTVVT